MRAIALTLALALCALELTPRGATMIMTLNLPTTTNLFRPPAGAFCELRLEDLSRDRLRIRIYAEGPRLPKVLGRM